MQTNRSLAVPATVNGKPAEIFDASAKRSGGNRHHTQVIASGLDPTREHTLEIEPVFTTPEEKELRLESICVAGGAATVKRVE